MDCVAHNNLFASSRQMIDKASIFTRLRLSIICCFSIAQLCSLHAQSFYTLPLSVVINNSNQHDISKHVRWTYDDNNGPNEIRDAPFKALGDMTDTIFNRSHTTVWLNMELANNTMEDQDVYLTLGHHEYIDLYSCDNFCTRRSSTGHIVHPDDRSISKNEEFLKITMTADEVRSYLIRIRSYRLSERRPIAPKMYSFSGYQSKHMESQPYRQMIILVFGLFAGSYIAFLIYPINLYVGNRKDYYLFYALHITAAIIALVLRSEIDLNLDLFFSFSPEMTYAVYHASSLFSIPFYTLFVSSFLDLKKNIPILNKLHVFIFTMTIVIMGISMIGSLFFGNIYFAHDLILVGKVLAMIVGVITFWILFQKNRTDKYIAAGTLLIFLGALITNVMRMLEISAFDGSVPHVLHWNLFYVHIGIFLEFVFFSLALGYNLNLMEREKESALKNWITQLKANEQIQENYKTKLEQDVKEQTNKILKIIKTLEEQERSQMESDFNKKLTDLELKALRAQMNPHFIFNSLNSIKHLIQKNEDELALNYLSRFSRLLRKSLQNVSLLEVTLEEELDFCKLYLEIESLRFDDGFKYNLIIDPSIDTSFVTIPPLMLQPYLENSLWHGLMHKNGDRKLNVIIKNNDNHTCEIIIDDNGIGRAAAERIKSSSEVNRKSFGMALTEERLKLTKDRNNQEITIEIKDKVDSEGQPLGTAVHLIITL